LQERTSVPIQNKTMAARETKIKTMSDRSGGKVNWVQDNGVPAEKHTHA